MLEWNVPPALKRLAENSCRVGHAFYRGVLLTEALVGVTIGTSAALASATLSCLPDTRLLRLVGEFTKGQLPPVEAPRIALTIAIFAGLMWAATACRKTREWFNPPGKEARS